MPSKPHPDLAMFTVGDPPGVGVPKKTTPASAKAKWRHRDAKAARLQCMDCIRYAHEHQKSYPPIRSATQVRSVPEHNPDYLCAEHAQIHRHADEELKAQIALAKQAERTARQMKRRAV